MHSSLNRAQAVFGFFTTVALFVAAFAALSVLLMPATDAKADVELKNVQVIKGRPHYYSTKKEEYAQIRFDLDADLSPLFNWNTKQLFVYVFASYPTSPSRSKSSSPTATSESIIWDTILPAPESPYSVNNLQKRFFPSAKQSKPKRGLSKKKAPTTPSSTDTPGILNLHNQRAKYQISDITGKMAERSNVTLTVGWNVQPWVGALWWGPGSGAVPHTEGLIDSSKPVDFPELKGSKPKAAEGAKEKV